MKQELKRKGKQDRGTRLGYPRWKTRKWPNNHSAWHLSPFPLQRASAELPQHASPRPMAATETLVPTPIYSVFRTRHSLFPTHLSSLSPTLPSRHAELQPNRLKGLSWQNELKLFLPLVPLFLLWEPPCLGLNHSFSNAFTSTIWPTADYLNCLHICS